MNESCDISKENTVKAVFFEDPMTFKLLFKKYHTGEIKINKENLFKTFELGGISKNLEIQICINVLKALLDQNPVYDYKIESDYNLISQAILKVYDKYEEYEDYDEDEEHKKLKIYDLFDKCKHRAVLPKELDFIDKWYIVINNKPFRIKRDLLNVREYYDIDKLNRTIKIGGKNFNFKWKKILNQIEYNYIEKPEQIDFCDAQRAKNDPNTKLIRYWCCNKYCYEPAQYDHIVFEWEEYTLRDFIKIFRINFKDDWYYRFVGILNRMNTLLSHFKCNCCGNYLRDVKSSNFAFYRVTTFHCINKQCSNYLHPIYLNHCLNWNCQNIIDSRESNKCQNGWYICNSCEICCIHEKNEELLKRYHDEGKFDAKKERYAKLEDQVHKVLAHYIIKERKIIENSKYSKDKNHPLTF